MWLKNLFKKDVVQDEQFNFYQRMRKFERATGLLVPLDKRDDFYAAMRAGDATAMEKICKS